jgi:hypothetical protein
LLYRPHDDRRAVLQALEHWAAAGELASGRLGNWRAAKGGFECGGRRWMLGWVRR